MGGGGHLVDAGGSTGGSGGPTGTGGYTIDAGGSTGGSRGPTGSGSHAVDAGGSTGGSRGPTGSGGRQSGSGGSAGSDAGVTGNPDGNGDAVDAKSDGVGPDTTAGGSFVAVQAIFARSCVRCHDPAHPIVPETPTFVEMPLTPATAYAALVNKPASETCGGMRVTPSDSARSYLYRKVTDTAPCDGKRMPHPGMLANGPPLADQDIATIAAWINAGAKP
jgi:hypothetical protein